MDTFENISKTTNYFKVQQQQQQQQQLNITTK